MSYHEHDLDRHSVSVSYGIAIGSWALPLEIGIGGSGLKERGFSISLLCFWFALRWWPRDYPVPLSARTDESDGHADWLKTFDPKLEFGYMIEALDIEASQLEASARKTRNSVDVLRDLYDKQTANDATPAKRRRGEG